MNQRVSSRKELHYASHMEEGLIACAAPYGAQATRRAQIVSSINPSAVSTSKTESPDSVAATGSYHLEDLCRNASETIETGSRPAGGHASFAFLEF